MNETIVPGVTTEATSTEATASTEATQSTQSSQSTETAAEPSWFWGEGAPGQGDKPEYLMDKYKSISEQARGYKELLMHHNDKLKGFVGTPEDGYERGEGNEENALMGMLSEVGAKYGMNQEMFGALVE